MYDNIPDKIFDFMEATNPGEELHKATLYLILFALASAKITLKEAYELFEDYLVVTKAKL